MKRVIFYIIFAISAYWFVPIIMAFAASFIRDFTEKKELVEGVSMGWWLIIYPISLFFWLRFYKFKCSSKEKKTLSILAFSHVLIVNAYVLCKKFLPNSPIIDIIFLVLLGLIVLTTYLATLWWSYNNYKVSRKLFYLIILSLLCSISIALILYYLYWCYYYSIIFFIIFSVFIVFSCIYFLICKRVYFNQNKVKKYWKSLIHHIILQLSLLVWVPIIGLGIIISLFIKANNGDFDTKESPMPTFEELEKEIPTNLATQILSSDGVVLGTFFQENRTNVRYDEISPHVINALISTEDERFYNHAGIDFKSTFRAAIFLGKKGGASTITQQLAKMLFSSIPGSKIDRIKQKFREWIIAVRLEKNYTKEEIITMYLNKFDFINLAVGISSAANTYFNKSASGLNIQEAATLVGMAKNPSYYNPKRYPERATERRNIVLGQMMRNGYINNQELDSLKKTKLILSFKKVDHNEGAATYFREYLREKVQQVLLKKEHLKPDGNPYNLYTDGLKIYTTIDSRLQTFAEEAVQEHLEVLQASFYKHWNNESEFPNAPFDTTFRQGQVDTIYQNVMINSDRYIKGWRKATDSLNTLYKVLDLKAELNVSQNKDEIKKEIEKIKNSSNYQKDIEKIKINLKNEFEMPVNMKVFSLKGEVDTTMSPIDSIKYYKYFLHSGLLSIDPKNGHVKAWVGGINHKYFKYDHVTSKRQVGSTFKPFVYATAIDQFKFSPCKLIANTQVIFEKGDKYHLEEDWMPKNANNQFGGKYTLLEGLAKSKNSITAYLMKEVGPKRVVEMAKKMGIKTKLFPVPSLCLGTIELSLQEMVSSYGTFANNGQHQEPIFITKIEDKNGIVIASFISESREVLNEEKNYIMIKLLQGVVNMGSGNRIKWKYNLTNEIAGKTGTTQNHTDGWFIGFVPNLVTGVWTGAEDSAVRFRDLGLGQGANMALPIWAIYMKKIYEKTELNISSEEFKFPKKGVSVNLDCDKEKEINNDNESFD